MDTMMIGQEINIKETMQVAGGVIMREHLDGRQEVLIIKRAPTDHWPNHWEFPRGKCDHGKNEDILSCLKREVKEETGLDVEPKFMIDSFKYIAGGTRLSTQINYLCYLNNPEQKIKLSKEHSEFKWITSVGEAELLVFADMKRTIAKVLHRDRQMVNYDSSKANTQLEGDKSTMSKKMTLEEKFGVVDKLIDSVLEADKVEDSEGKKPREADSGEKENEIETGDKPDTPMKTMKDLKDEVSESIEFKDDFQQLIDRLETLRTFL